ncbi:class I SAM-dependent methyltransferase [Streptomyces hypolithicus]
MTLSIPPHADLPTIPAPPAKAVDHAIDQGIWPDVVRVPRTTAARTAIARLIVRGGLGKLPLRLRLGNGAETGTTGPLLHVRDPETFFRRIGDSGLIGFGESYMAREWDSDDLVGVLSVIAGHVDDLVPRPLRSLRRAWVRRRPAAQRNTPQGSRENIQRHYDLSNDLFALFLDETMSYSAALFPALPADRDAFVAAQHHKIDRLLDQASVGPGTRVLEIGTGWGELALRAAARGAHVVSVTLSAEQRRLARERIAQAGLSDRVTVKLCDYRDVEGSYDAVVSVEMIEAVGSEYWSVYFATLRRLCAPGGRIVLQAITMPHERMLNTSRTHTWISKYIFPGGLIPSMKAIERESSRAGLKVAADFGFGEHYAETLRLWRESFTRRADAVDALGFDATFRRMWELYLAYSEAGFRARYLDVRQLLLTESTLIEEGAR